MQQKNIHLLFAVFFLFILLSACSHQRHLPQAQSLSVAEFTENPFETEITPDLLEKEFGRRLKLEKETVENIHVPNQIDTILVYTFRQSSFYFYQSPEKTLFFRAEIFTPRLLLTGNIRKGIKRDTFFDSFKDLEDNRENFLQLEDEGQFISTGFFLNRNKLQHITIEQYID